jgi:hypothetical protein
MDDDEYEQVQNEIEKFMKTMYDKKAKDRYKVVEEFEKFIFKMPYSPELT